MFKVWVNLIVIPGGKAPPIGNMKNSIDHLQLNLSFQLQSQKYKNKLISA